jgi:23S rRNA-/tRNA-specific pseudouridylate synthase
MERFRAHTLLSCQLETGRTHQIRVHLNHIRHGIVGDPLYGPGLKLPKGGERRRWSSACAVSSVRPCTRRNWRSSIRARQKPVVVQRQ